MKKIILFIIVFWGIKLYTQNQPTLPNGVEHNLSPNGLFDKVFDHYGNSYNLSDIMINKDSRGRDNLKTTNSTPFSCGYYNLYFETDSGMENTSNPIHVARRDVLCRVLTDLSNFINSPLTTNGLNNKVNIWVRDINNVVPPEYINQALGAASSFYTVPGVPNFDFGGIVDNEIWKTIHLGKDSYFGIFFPLQTNNNGQPQFYHGMMTFNFYSPDIEWNTSLTSTSFPDKYDLYTVILHEMIHALGFESLIDSNGFSRFGAFYNYYSRYDTHLKNNANTQFLIQKPKSACGSMYNYAFNTLLNPSILQSNDNCNQSVRYVGLSNVRVHTPPVFLLGSSLSHFEGDCIQPNPNFVMEALTPEEVIRRFPKLQERNVLGEIGYNVKNTFGVSSTYQGTTTYLGTLTGINVAGMNDGIDISGVFTYTGKANTNIQISNFLTNDTNATGFECLQRVYSTSTLSVTSGDSNTTVNFSSSEHGLHLLRYVPTNGTQRGNITYIFVYVEPDNNCGTPTTCNLVINGDFEDFNESPYYIMALSNINQACNWSNGTFATSDYFNADLPFSQTPCNDFGFENDNITSNKGYAGIHIYYNPDAPSKNYSEVIKTQLSAPLLPNTNYQLTFDVSLAENYSYHSIKFQAYLSDTFASYSTNEIEITNPNMLFTDTSYSTTTDGWNKVVFNFTTDNVAGQNTLYIGSLTVQDIMNNVPIPTDVGDCDSLTWEYSLFSYYYIDNVSLIPLNCMDCLDVEYLVFSSPEDSSPVTYNTSDYIETNTNYLVNSTADVSLKASNYILMKPQSQINSGAQFLARIENCDGTPNAKMMNPVTTSENYKPISFSENNELLDVEILGLKIYPNPSDGLINISNTTVIDSVTITDMNGRVVKNTALETSEGQIDISDLSHGIYILNITSNGETFTKKIVKQ